MNPTGRPTLRRRVLLALAGLALLASALFSSSPLLAEDLDPATLFDSAKAAYGEKKYGKALQDLNLLVKELGRLRMESLKPTLPAAPAGWTAEEVEGDATAQGLAIFGAGGIFVKRTYRKGDETQVTVTLTADSPAVAGFVTMFPTASKVGWIGVSAGLLCCVRSAAAGGGEDALGHGVRPHDAAVRGG